MLKGERSAPCFSFQEIKRSHRDWPRGYGSGEVQKKHKHKEELHTEYSPRLDFITFEYFNIQDIE